MEQELQELCSEIEDFCGALAISQDSPDAETIKEWFEKYENIKNSFNVA